MNNPGHYLLLMSFWYVVTIAIETAILVVGLSRRHSLRNRLFAGAWLTACTYPVVWLVLPRLISDYTLYLTAAETFAPVAECLLFWLAFGKTEPRTRSALIRDMTAIVIANLASFGGGWLLQKWIGDGTIWWEWLREFNTLK